MDVFCVVVVIMEWTNIDVGMDVFLDVTDI
jgi:hypothetical protein